MEKKAQNSEDEDPWVQYDLLKQRLKRLRVRFYNGRVQAKKGRPDYGQYGMSAKKKY